ncbi:MAG TPA: type II toxin-antitoxin system RelE/ParE family toxin [Longimicrobiaceae bacterium]|nr:type II toxin-antitoxin system RelE/ParE family toxin [Longimicrobiaceae bacterium]
MISFIVRSDIPLQAYSSLVIMAWKTKGSPEFERWFERLNGPEQEDVIAAIGLLQQRGPQLGAPHSSSIEQSRFGHMRELRIQHAGRPYRVLYAFDPHRTAVLLVGGDKTGKDRWYDIHVPIADRLYEEYLQLLRREGLT